MKQISYVIVLLFFYMGRSHAQTKASAPMKQDILITPVILSHYSPSELEEMRIQFPEKYKTILYYYNQSYIIEKISCSDYTPTKLENFDISQYEHYRLKHSRYTREFTKHGFKLTLLATDELMCKLPIHQKP